MPAKKRAPFGGFWLAFCARHSNVFAVGKFNVGTIKVVIAVALVGVALVGCATPDSKSGAARTNEKGPDGTVAYYVIVESSEPDTKIEVNYEMVGTAPLKLKIWGDTDGTFHNFASYDYVVRAYPARQGLAPQIKHFRCGGLFQQEDIIPSRIVFYFAKTEAK